MGAEGGGKCCAPGIIRRSGVMSRFGASGSSRMVNILRVLPSKFKFLEKSGCLSARKSMCMSPSRVEEFGVGAKSGMGKVAERPGAKRGFETLLCIRGVGSRGPRATVREGTFRLLAPVCPRRELALREDRDSVTAELVSLVSPVNGKREKLVITPPGTNGADLLGGITGDVTGGRPGIRLVILLVSREPRRIASVERSVGKSIVCSAFSRMSDRRIGITRVILGETRELIRRKGSIMVLLSDVAELTETCGLAVSPANEALSKNLSPKTLRKPGGFFNTTEGVERNKSLAVLTATLMRAKSEVSSMVFRRFGNANGVRLGLSEGLTRGEVFPTMSVCGSKAEERSLLLARRRGATL